MNYVVIASTGMCFLCVLLMQFKLGRTSLNKEFFALCKLTWAMPFIFKQLHFCSLVPGKQQAEHKKSEILAWKHPQNTNSLK
jgi:hypothetical protein